MNDRPRAALIELVRVQGRPFFTDPQRIYSELRSACPDCPGEVMALFAASRQDVPSSLLAAAADPATQWQPIVAALAQRLQGQEQMPADFASWAVDSWALALGIASPATSVVAPLSAPILVSAAAPVVPPPQLQGSQPIPPPPYSPPPAPYQSPSPTQKSSKAGIIIVVVLLAVVVIGGILVYTRSHFDSSLAGNWQSDVRDGSVVSSRDWEVASDGAFQLSELLNDSGSVDVNSPESILELHSSNFGDLPVHYRFDGQERLYFNGPPFSFDGDRLWDWSTTDRGIPPPGKLTFVGIWLTSAPQHGLAGSSTLTIGYDAAYKLASTYHGSGRIQTRAGQYTILADSGAQVATGAYSANGADQIVFRGSDGSLLMTWSRATH